VSRAHGEGLAEGTRRPPRAPASIARRLRAPLLGALLVSLLASASASADTFVYKPRSRLAEELLPIAQAALGGEGNAVVDRGTNSLVLLGPADSIARARALLEQQDQALRNVTVYYEAQRASELAASGVRVAWQVGGAGVRVGTVRGPAAGNRVAIRPEAREGREQAGSRGMLRVLEGQPARIASGVEVPVTTRSISRRAVETTTGYAQAESGFEVVPRVLGDGRVRLDVLPFDARVAGGQPGRPVIARSGAETSVVVVPGERVAIASLGGARVSRDTGISGGGTSAASDDLLLVVWVELDLAGGTRR
jgi:type II secretory pathway component HofQ